MALALCVRWGVPWKVARQGAPSYLVRPVRRYGGAGRTFGGHPCRESFCNVQEDIVGWSIRSATAMGGVGIEEGGLRGVQELAGVVVGHAGALLPSDVVEAHDIGLDEVLDALRVGLGFGTPVGSSGAVVGWRR